MYAELDTLYKTILKGALDDGLEETEMDQLRLVLWTVVCVCEPVTVQTLARLTGTDEENTAEVLQSLQSVLHISEPDNVVSTLHASFYDFIFTQERSQGFFCNEELHAPTLAQQCFEVMKSELRFNICKLESSFVLDEEVEDLEKRVDEHISPEISYACKYWGEHMSLAAPADDLCIMLEDFLSNRLLFWMEVLNLSKFRTLGTFILETINSSAEELLGDWDVRPSGWVVNQNGQYLFWVPPHIRPFLPRLHTSYVVCPRRHSAS